MNKQALRDVLGALGEKREELLPPVALNRVQTSLALAALADASENLLEKVKDLNEDDRSTFYLYMQTLYALYHLAEPLGLKNEDIWPETLEAHQEVYNRAKAKGWVKDPVH
jgi:hypothetical protein